MNSHHDQINASSTATRTPFAWLGRIIPPLLALVLVGCLWLASAIAVPVALQPWSSRLQGFTTVFLGIFIEALPFLMAGVLVSSAIHLYVSEDVIQRLSPRNPFLAAIVGALIGLAFPVCECGSIPAARRLLTKGMALPAGIAFTLAAPVINPIVLISTYVAFGSWEMVAWRAGLTMVIAVVIAVLMGTPTHVEEVLTTAACRPDHDHDHDHDPKANPLSQILSHANTEFFEMSRYLVAGGLLAATLQTLVPQQTITALGNGPVISILVMIALAAVLSICSTVDAFIALSFVGTFTPGAIMAFLVFGPMIDIKSTLMLTSTFRRRTVALIILFCFQLALLTGVLINFYLP